MLIDPAIQFRLAQAKDACIERMQETADWLLAADQTDRDSLRQCGHRLTGTLGSFGFTEAAKLAAALEKACGDDQETLRTAVEALVAALRNLPR